MRWAGAGLAACLLVGCGGGGGGEGGTTGTTGTGSTGGTTSTTSRLYADSLVMGLPSATSVTYLPASGTTSATVSSAEAGTVLPVGPVPLTAEHDDTAAPGVIVACVSGRGESIGAISGINLGVLSVSAAVLMDTRWQTVDVNTAWAAAVAASEQWVGWENCGVKPEGAPSPSSRLTLASDGGYTEDVYDGNPGTTFNTLRNIVSAADTAAMRSPAGLLVQQDPRRPLTITWVCLTDNQGHRIWIERGEPAAGAPAGTRGFIALFVP